MTVVKFVIVDLQGKAFFFTVFVSNDIFVHPTSSEKADNFIQTQIGKMLTPPASMERIEALGKPVSEVFEVNEV